MQEALEEKIQNTEWEFVPLDKMIPLKTAINIFDREYTKSKGVDYFKRKFQRLREIYFSLFVCRALDVMEKREHFLCFHKRQDFNDVSFISINNEGDCGNIQYYDVKEYVNNQDGINVFLANVLKKVKYKDYNLIIGIHKDGKLELNLNSIKKSVFFVSNVDGQSDNNYKSQVRLVSQKQVVFDEVVDLNNLIDDEATNIIYHDRLNLEVPK